MKEKTAETVIKWAEDFMKQAANEIGEKEKKEQNKYATLVQNPGDKILMSKLLDESSQIRDNAKLAKRIKILLNRYDVPKFFSPTDRRLLQLFTTLGYHFPAISIPLFKRRLRQETASVIINEKESSLTKHLQQRKNAGIGQNVNLLGEVVLGDEEAANRYNHYIKALTDSRINYISVKLSGIYAQINPLNYAQCKEDLCKLMGNIYQQAMDYPDTLADGTKVPKFVNLDMEEYKDVELTLDVFMSVMSEERFMQLTAGIVIQAYLTDAEIIYDKLSKFAKERYAKGGAPLKFRLVKGANLQMESIVCSLKGWETPVQKTKIEVDANYMHILDKALKRENAEALRIGVASHNFFTIGYANLTSIENGTEEFINFEMLEGMANHLPRVMRKLQKRIVLYTPVVSDEHFLNAVSYLVRRIDENTGKDNFLTYSFNLQKDSKEWNFLRSQFEKAFELKDKMQKHTNRLQDRNLPAVSVDPSAPFTNEADTDFDLPQNRRWADSIRNRWEKKSTDSPYSIPVQIGNQQIESTSKDEYIDHSKDEKLVICNAHRATLENVTQILETAEKDESNWRKTTLKHRKEILYKVAENLANSRGDLIGVMAAITGKTFNEGDVEVSEAIDFCRFYPTSMETFENLKTVSYSPKGTVLVIPPWNFPTAIPVGGVVAALTGGNSVILKPASVAYPIAWEFVQCFWNAGVPKDALQIVLPESKALNFLSGHSSIKHIIMTGGTDTAFKLLENNPHCPLSAETGGKNAIIITAKGDRDHAILNVVKSAFGNAGQKCSACSLLIVDKSIYNDPDFKLKLKDAVLSTHTGSVWNGGNIVGPLATNTNSNLLHAIDNLEAGEEWLVKPEFVDKNRYILKPCVKWGVKQDSFTFKNELFGPLLAVVSMDNLKHGIELVNSGEYGLTSGLQSLDEKERKLWKESIEAGNLYINRGITGAIVQRQPFGGMKRSAFGGGIKAGGDNYVSCFVNFEETTYQEQTSSNPYLLENFAKIFTAEELARYHRSLDNYGRSWKNVFAKEHITQSLMGELNTFRYLPIKDIILRVMPTDNIVDIFLAITASKLCGTNMTLSVSPKDEKEKVLKNIPKSDITLYVQTDEEFLKIMNSYERVRTCTNNLPNSYYAEAARLGKHIATAKPLCEGRLELLHYLKEQSISYEYHRYGSFSVGDDDII